eukprot:scaffold271486_cov37-Tisochrysis_lutea.AAC.2
MSPGRQRTSEPPWRGDGSTLALRRGAVEEEDSAVTVMGGRIDCGGEEEKAEGREKRKRGK